MVACVSADPGVDPADHFAIGLDLPDAIAAHYNKVYVLIFGLGDVWTRTDHLLLGLQVAAGLVLVVSEGPRKIQASIDPAEADSASGLLDPFELDGILRLVILAEFLGFALDAGN